MDKETEVLQNNIQSQLERLISQLKDLEELKGEAGLEEDEIAEMKSDTMEQIKEFDAFLKRAKEGDMTLLDSVQDAKIKLQEAIAKAFNAKEIMDNYAAKEPEFLRGNLTLLSSDLNIGKLTQDKFNTEASKILDRLSKIDKLNEYEQHLLSELQKAKFGELVETEKKELTKESVFGQK